MPLPTLRRLSLVDRGGWVVLSGVLILPQRILHENAQPPQPPAGGRLQPALHPRRCGCGGWRWPGGLRRRGCWRCIPLRKLGSEFMPPLEEGDLLYMPTTDPGISTTKARELLQQTDRLIRAVPRGRERHGQDRPGRDRHRPRPRQHVRDHDHARARQEQVAPGAGRPVLRRLARVGPRPARAASGPRRGRSRWTNWSTATTLPGGRPRAGPERGRPGARPDELLDHAHPHPHRHALDRHQDARGHQGHGAGPRDPLRPGRPGRPGRQDRRADRPASPLSAFAEKTRRRVVPRHRHQPRRDRPLRPLRPGRAGRHLHGHGRHGRHAPPSRAWSGTPSTSATRANSATA